MNPFFILSHVFMPCIQIIIMHARLRVDSRGGKQFGKSIAILRSTKAVLAENPQKHNTF